MLIAQTTLRISLPDREHDLNIRISAPYDDGACWMCEAEIDWPEGTKRLRVGGHDSAQAPILSLYYIGSQLNTSGYHETGQLRSPDGMDGYGFPVPFNVRDLLRPGDVRFV